MATFNIQANGLNFGDYVADSEQEARDLCAQDAGYESEADMERQIEEKSALVAVEIEYWVAWLDGKRDEGVTFSAPVGGTYDIAQAGAAALGIGVCDELNVARA